MKTKTKKVTSLILGLVLFLSVFQVPFGIEVAAEEAVDVNTLFTVDEGHKSTTTITGDKVEGATFELSGSDRTRIMTTETYPVSTLSFDYGYRYSGNQFGEFGISKNGDITHVDDGFSGSDKLTFFYRPDNGTLRISVRWNENEKTEKLIGVFNSSEHRPGDAYWNPNVSNFSFTEVDGHWHLVVDGNVCNNVEENFEYSCLEHVFNSEIFEKNEEVHIYFGGYGSGKGYFKQLSATSADGMWESRAVESYRYNYYGWREYRGQGDTENTVHSKIPAAATGSAESGHLVDFTGTDGYAQTTAGYDLKTTTFHIAPITYTGNTNNLWYYLGFTSNSSAFQYHTAKPGESIELYAASVYADGYTGAWLSTNNPATETYADVSSSKISLGRFGQWATHNYESDYTSPRLHISFLQDTGADGELHWYMQTAVSGVTRIIKSENTEEDKYLQFDSMIDKPVYFRMGSHGTVTDASFKMYCKIEETKAITVDTVYQSLDFGDYTVDFENGATFNDKQYACGDTVSEVGEYKLKYNEDSIKREENLAYSEYNAKYCRNLVLYRLGDTNADNKLGIHDLIALKKYSAKAKELDNAGIKAADMNLDGSINSSDMSLLRKTLAVGSGIAITGYGAEDMEDLVDFTVEVESGREIRVLQLTDPQIIESEQQRVAGRLTSDNATRWSKENKEEMYKKYFTSIINESSPDLILLTGDLVYGEFDDSGEAFTEFVTFMDSFEIPWAPVFGNHENESAKGVDWQCSQLEASQYALFKQRELTGNGNYCVGLKQDGVYKRVFFMLDSNGCANASATSLANGHTQTGYGFGEDQIEWYTSLAQKMRYCVPELKISAAFHVQLATFEKACLKYGFVDGNANTNPVNLDTLANKTAGDFGYLGENLANKWDEKENVYYGFKSLGFDSFFVGHTHRNSASIQYQGIRFQFGQKSSTYDSANYLQADGSYSTDYSNNATPIIGGTSVTIDNDGSLKNCELLLYGKQS